MNNAFLHSFLSDLAVAVHNFVSYVMYIQGLPSGFDLMYLALADRNMQVRFGLKVVWES